MSKPRPAAEEKILAVVRHPGLVVVPMPPERYAHLNIRVLLAELIHDMTVIRGELGGGYTPQQLVAVVELSHAVDRVLSLCDGYRSE